MQPQYCIAAAKASKALML